MLAYDLDAVSGHEIAADGGLGKIGVAMHRARDRTFKFLRHDHDDARVFLIARGQVGCR